MIQSWKRIVIELTSYVRLGVWIDIIWWSIWSLIMNNDFECDRKALTLLRPWNISLHFRDEKHNYIKWSYSNKFMMMRMRNHVWLWRKTRKISAWFFKELESVDVYWIRKCYRFRKYLIGVGYNLRMYDGDFRGCFTPTVCIQTSSSKSKWWSTSTLKLNWK